MRGQTQEIKAYRALWIKEHPEKRAEYAARYCPSPEARERRLEAGRKRDRLPDRRAAQKARLRQWQQDNAAYVSAKVMERYRKQERLSKDEAQSIFSYYGTQCVYCGALATGFDHLHPVSKGGRNIAENLAPACFPCNARKHNRPIWVMLAQVLEGGDALWPTKIQ
jgi:5-methylcytosine-specific restriction endonuclease McrA